MRETETVPQAGLDDLLKRPRRHGLPERIDGIVLGQIDSVGAHGEITLLIPSFESRCQAVASLVPVSGREAGKSVALGFEAGDPLRPMVLGYLFEADKPGTKSSEPSLRQENGRWIIEADSQLELRCGEARIILDADGRIHIRGTYVTSHASASQRIRGGSVQIN